MADVNTTTNVLARSPGAACTLVAAAGLDFLENQVGTSKVLGAPTLNGASVPKQLIVPFDWTGTDTKTYHNDLVVWMGFLDKSSAGASEGSINGEYLLGSPGFSNRMVVNKQAPGCASDTLANCKIIWNNATFGFATNLALLLGFSYGFVSESDSGFANASMNTQVYWSTGQWIYGGDVGISVHQVTFINVDSGGLQLLAISDGWQGISAAPVTSGPGGMSAIVEALNDIAQMDTTVSINRGAAIYSVKGGVVVG